MDQQVTDFIQEALDGSNGEAGQARLQVEFGDDPKVASCYHEMKAMFELLGSLPPIDPPRDLVPAVMQRVSAATQAAAPARFQARRLLPLAAALLVGILLHALMVRVIGTSQELAPVVSGTLLDAGSTQSLTAQDRSEIAADGVEGFVRLHADGRTAALELDLTSEAPLRLELLFDVTRVRFQGFSLISSRIETFESHQDGVRFLLEPKTHTLLYLSRESGSAQNLDLRLHPLGLDPVTVMVRWPESQ